MSTSVILTVTEGNLERTRYVFEEPVECVVGRAVDCEIQVPADLVHADISRHHCLLAIDPPAVRVRDLGSLNGTYVNGESIGQRSSAQAGAETELGERELRDGDVVQIGHTVLRVGVVADDSPGVFVPMNFA
jgi:pSer/pThr/pTyr-binding forkhead associated (FHA) protein